MEKRERVGEKCYSGETEQTLAEPGDKGQHQWEATLILHILDQMW